MFFSPEVLKCLRPFPVCIRMATGGYFYKKREEKKKSLLEETGARQNKNFIINHAYYSFFVLSSTKMHFFSDIFKS
jgi:hypothetical protein